MSDKIARVLRSAWRAFNMALCGHPVDARVAIGMTRVYGARIIEYRCRYCTGTVSEYHDINDEAAT